MRTQTETIWDSRFRDAGRRLDNGEQGILLTDIPAYADRVRVSVEGQVEAVGPAGGLMMPQPRHGAQVAAR
ncbi:MAG: hypothetical protein HEQ23_06155 [Tepidisphaera sp.]